MDSVYWENNGIKYYCCFRSLAFLSDISILRKFVKIDVSYRNEEQISAFWWSFNGPDPGGPESMIRK